MPPIITVYRAVQSVSSDKGQLAIIDADQPYLAEIVIGDADPSMYTYISQDTGLRLQTTMNLGAITYTPEFIEALIGAVSLISDGYSNYHEGEAGERFFDLTSYIHIDTHTNKLYYKDFTPA
ncbi:hypothetical protein VXQ16_10670 [Acinetobacter baumannii]|uniref:hypothetical protein n=1 Tax=Acinetobacter baumannii TaxID=470 RepID=UPI003A8B5A8F